MPEPNERRTVNGVTRQWDGTAWRQVREPSAPAAVAPGRWTDYLDEAGGLAGGLAGTAVPALGVAARVPAAAVGGALGRGAGMAIDTLAYGDPVPADWLQQLARAGAVEGGSEALGGAVAKGLKGGARMFYTSALKPTEAAVKATSAVRKGGAKTAGQREIADTLLQRGLALSEAGWTKGWEAMDAASRRIQQALRAPGTPPITKADMVSELQKTVAPSGAARASAAPQAEIAATEQLIQDVMNHPDYTQIVTRPNVIGKTAYGPPITTRTDLPVPAPEAFGMLQKTYQATKGKWGVPSAIDPEIMKNLAVGQRRALGKAAPAIEAPLAEQSALIPALQALNDAGKRIANNNAVSLMDATAILGGVGMGVGTGNPAYAAPFAAYSLLRRPAIGGPVARGAYQLGRVTPAASHGVSALAEYLMEQEQRR